MRVNKKIADYLKESTGKKRINEAHIYDEVGQKVADVLDSMGYDKAEQLGKEMINGILDAINYATRNEKAVENFKAGVKKGLK